MDDLNKNQSYWFFYYYTNLPIICTGWKIFLHLQIYVLVDLKIWVETFIRPVRIHNRNLRVRCIVICWSYGSRCSGKPEKLNWSRLARSLPTIRTEFCSHSRSIHIFILSSDQKCQVTINSVLYISKRNEHLHCLQNYLLSFDNVAVNSALIKNVLYLFSFICIEWMYRLAEFRQLSTV